MNMNRTKKDSELRLDGIAISVDRKDGNIHRVGFVDAKGNSVVIEGTGWGAGFDVLVPAAPKMVKRHQVAGKLKGIAFCETFEHEHEALARVSDIGVDADPIAVTVVEVPEES